ncbi:MAG TPA: RNA polymerase sigma factor [Candidatus Limnocylindrales bacterium]|jgi:RNA polymerase sigma-70 factor (ECF subfamily)
MEAIPLPAAQANTQEIDSEDVAERARHDSAAFGELYIACRDVVFRYLRARCGNESDALDLTAVTFERAFEAIPRYRTQGGGVLAWLLRIARNAAIDDARRQRRVVGTADDSGRSYAKSPEDEMLSTETHRLVQMAVARLPEDQREAVGLRFGAGLTARQIGLVIGKSEEATQKLISRAIVRLREDLNDR